MNPVKELIYKAMERKGLSKAELVKKAGCFNETNGLRMLEELLSGRNLVGFRHTPIRRLPEVLEIPQEKFDETVAKFAETLKIAAEDRAARKGVYNERTFKPHLWIKASRTTPEPIFVACICGEAPFKHVPLPDGVVSEDGKVNWEAVGQVIREHYKRSKGSAIIFGDIVSYYLRLSYHGPSIEFSPDGQIIDTDPPPVSRGEASLSVGNKEIPRALLDELTAARTPEMAESVESTQIYFDIDKEFDA